MQQQDTPTLIDHASQGDPGAIDALLVKHLPCLTAYVRLHAGLLVKSRESVSDLAQSVCLEVLQSMGTFEYRGEAPFRKWLCELAMSKIRSRQRKLRSAKRDPARETNLGNQHVSQVAGTYAAFVSPSRVAMGKEELEQVAVEFEKLSTDYQQVITMSRVFGMTHAEISAEMGRNEGAVRVLLHRALVRLAWLMDRGKTTDREE